MTGPRRPPVFLKTAVIVDIDGTLCDISGVLHYVDGSLGTDSRGKPLKDFDKFHEAAAFCPPNQQALDYVAAAVAAGHAVIIGTARMERHRQSTYPWLVNTIGGPDGIAPDFMGPIMRPEHDYRPDVEIKTDMLKVIRKAGFAVVGAIDDNPSIIELWESNHIPTEQVPRPAGDASLIEKTNREGA